jgi:hypothetical protein
VEEIQVPMTRGLPAFLAAPLLCLAVLAATVFAATVFAAPSSGCDYGSGFWVP